MQEQIKSKLPVKPSKSESIYDVLKALKEHQVKLTKAKLTLKPGEPGKMEQETKQSEHRWPGLDTTIDLSIFPPIVKQAVNDILSQSRQPISIPGSVAKSSLAQPGLQGISRSPGNIQEWMSRIGTKFGPGRIQERPPTLRLVDGTEFTPPIPTPPQITNPGIAGGIKSPPPIFNNEAAGTFKKQGAGLPTPAQLAASTAKAINPNNPVFKGSSTPWPWKSKIPMPSMGTNFPPAGPSVASQVRSGMKAPFSLIGRHPKLALGTTAAGLTGLAGYKAYSPDSSVAKTIDTIADKVLPSSVREGLGTANDKVVKPAVKGVVHPIDTVAGLFASDGDQTPPAPTQPDSSATAPAAEPTSTPESANEFYKRTVNLPEEIGAEAGKHINHPWLQYIMDHPWQAGLGGAGIGLGLYGLYNLLNGERKKRYKEASYLPPILKSAELPVIGKGLGGMTNIKPTLGGISPGQNKPLLSNKPDSMSTTPEWSQHYAGQNKPLWNPKDPMSSGPYMGRYHSEGVKPLLSTNPNSMNTGPLWANHYAGQAKPLISSKPDSMATTSAWANYYAGSAKPAPSIPSVAIAKPSTALNIPPSQPIKPPVNIGMAKPGSYLSILKSAFDEPVVKGLAKSNPYDVMGQSKPLTKPFLNPGAIANPGIEGLGAVDSRDVGTAHPSMHSYSQWPFVAGLMGGKQITNTHIPQKDWVLGAHDEETAGGPKGQGQINDRSYVSPGAAKPDPFGLSGVKSGPVESDYKGPGAVNTGSTYRDSPAMGSLSKMPPIMKPPRPNFIMISPNAVPGTGGKDRYTDLAANPGRQQVAQPRRFVRGRPIATPPVTIAAPKPSNIVTPGFNKPLPSPISTSTSPGTDKPIVPLTGTAR